MAAIDKEFDYLVPPEWDGDGRSERLKVGSMVRVVLHGRRVAGWVVADGVRPVPGVELSGLAKLSGEGPPEEILELARWAGWRWAGRRVAFLRTASPPRMLDKIPPAPPGSRAPEGPAGVFDEAFDLETAVVRLPPSADPIPLALAACRRGDALILVPESAMARHLAVALRRAGIRVALAPDDWASAAAGATVVGTRSGVWMPVPGLAAVVVFDEHDEAYQQERAPTWNARDVALERARRREVPVVLASATPSLDALRAGRLLRPSRSAEREGWPLVEVIDRRDDDPTRGGPFSDRLVDWLRDGRRVVCVLNRKGRARLLACASCGELVRSEDRRSLMIQVDDRLTTPDGSESRPIVCASCGATTLRNLRMGVGRAREELAALVGEDVDDVTADRSGPAATRVVIGTEAVLHRVDRADVVAFLDFDQELLAPRQRANEQALVLAARAARLLGSRRDGGRLVIQTRQPDHEVVRAVTLADPSIVAIAERDRRRQRGWPPYGAQVLLVGAGAAEFVDSLGSLTDVDVLGPAGDSWLLRADTHAPILDGLQRTRRPAARLRVEVDPTRV